MRQKCDRLSVRVCTVLFFLLISGTLLAQKTVTGMVTAAKTSQPVSFASVTVKGTNVATATDAAGAFSIRVPAGKNVLTVTSVGFAEQDVTIGTGPVNVVLQETTSTLDEIVVTGYTAQKKKDLTGSVAVVSVKDMKSIPAGNPENMLQGQAAGVNVITSGAPGANSNIFIRGISNFGNVDPLVIIDGVQGSLHDINANDIESLQVLKDAGSAAIYGVRGSNGVIIVTTKRGKAGRSTITYDGYYGTQQPLQGNVWHLLNSQEMATALWKADINSGNVAANGNPQEAQYGNGASPVLPAYLLVGNNYGVTGSLTPAEIASYNVDYSKGNIYQITEANDGVLPGTSVSGTDWFHQVFKNAPIQSHTLTASGGNERSTYLFSLGAFDQQGTALATYLRRYSVRVNTTFNVKDHIRVGENAYMFFKENPSLTSGGQNGNPGNFNVGNVNEGLIAETYREQVIIPVHDINGNWAGSAGSGLGNANNAVADQTRSEANIGYTWDVVGNIWAEADFLKHFTYRTSYGGTMDNGYYTSYGYHTYENAENNGSNSFSEGSDYNTTWTWTNTLTYSNTFAQKHSLKVLAGYESLYSHGRDVGGNRLNYFTDDPSLRVLSAGSPAGQTNYSGVYGSALASSFGRVDYNYNSKYYLSGTFRRDGYSAFGSDNRYGNFPSVSASWRISQESFFKGISWVTDLKIRATYGILGNYSNINAVNSYTLYNSGAGNSYYPIGGGINTTTQGFYPSQYGSNNTSWEKDKVTNIGFDGSFFKGKLDVTADWYKKAISGLLFQDQAPYYALGGAQAPYVNIGDVQNTGVDLGITYHGSVGRDFKYNIAANITTYKNMIVSIPGTGGFFTTGGSRVGNIVRDQTGHATSSFYGFKVIGLYQSAADVSKSPTEADAAPGRFKYADIDGDGQITTNDETFIGNPNPKFTYGLNLNASYKNFDFTAIFYGSQGADIFNYVRYWTDFWASFQGAKSQTLLYDSWTPNNLNAKAPLIENGSYFSTNTQVNSYYIEKGSFLKLRSLIVGYNIPGSQIKSIGIDRIRVYLQGSNLFTITKYSGLDPELSGSAQAFGIDYGNYPSNQKIFIAGVNVSF